VEISCPRAANLPPFNTLLLFAPFECNSVFHTDGNPAKKFRDNGKIIRSKTKSAESPAKLSVGIF